MNETKKIEIDESTLQQLVSNFYKVCSLCDELDIYEWEEGDDSMQEMKEWANTNFGRKLEKIK